jgi:hypothetical protein
MITTSENATQNGAGSAFIECAHLSRIVRADERTRTADLTSSRVISWALQGFTQP